MSWNIKTPGDYINGPLTVAGSATITGDLTVDTSTLQVDSTNHRVGIGAAIPGAPLHLQSATAIFKLESTTGTNAVYLYATSAGGDFYFGRDNSTGTTFGTGTAYSAVLYSANSNPMVFYTNAIERYRIDSTGISTWFVAGSTAMTLNSTGLGIGASPSSLLHVQKSQNNETTLILNTTNAGTSASVRLDLQSHASNYITLQSYGQNYVGTPFGIAGAKLNVISENAATAFSSGLLIGTTSTNPLYFATANAVRMTLDASGNLLVGKTANYGTGETNTLQLKTLLVFGSDNTANAANRNWSIGTNASAAGNMEWTISSTNIGWPNFAYRLQLTSAGDVNNTTGTYGTISDLRLKENISDARNYLADLLKLRVVKYSLKEESSAVATKLGFIAQEVEQVFPNLVDQSDKEYEGAEGIRSVKTSILIPMLLKAIQELTARVQTLEAR